MDCLVLSIWVHKSECEPTLAQKGSEIGNVLKPFDHVKENYIQVVNKYLVVE